jgi:hypothetical protein
MSTVALTADTLGAAALEDLIQHVRAIDPAELASASVTQ